MQHAIKRVLIEPQGGLCNRMLAVHSAAALARALDRPLDLRWIVTDELGARFDELFEPLPIISRASTFVKMRPTIAQRIQYLISCRMPYFSIRPNFTSLQISQMEKSEFDFLSLSKLDQIYIKSWSLFFGHEEQLLDFKPVVDVRHRTAEIRERFGRTVGVHIRRTDNLEAIRESPTSLMFDALQQEIDRDPDTTFFLATDDINERLAAQERFGDRVISADTQRYERSSVAAIKDALVELYCLAACDRIIGCAGSTFSHTAARIGGIQLNIVQR